MLQQMLEVDHEQGHAWHTLGQMEEEQGQLQAARDCYQRGSHSSGKPAHTCRFLAAAWSLPWLLIAVHPDAPNVFHKGSPRGQNNGSTRQEESNTK